MPESKANIDVKIHRLVQRIMLVTGVAGSSLIYGASIIFFIMGEKITVSWFAYFAPLLCIWFGLSDRMKVAIINKIRQS